MPTHKHSVPRYVLLKGAIAFLLVFYLAVVFRAPVVEQDILRRSQQALTQHNLDVSTEVSGRDVTLVNEDNNADELMDARQVVSHLLGVRSVAVEMNTRSVVNSVLPYAQPVVEKVEASDGIPLSMALKNAGLIDSMVQSTEKPAEVDASPMLHQPESPPNGIPLAAAVSQVTSESAVEQDAEPEQPIPAEKDPLPPLEKGKLDIKGVGFLRNTTRLTQSSLPKLQEIIDLTRDYPAARIEISGFTDSWGKRSYNLRLSKQRAEAVQTYLIKQGVDPHQLVARGYGEAKPVATNKTDRGRRANRRIEFYVIEP